MPSLTVAYMTNRRQPRLSWFLESLRNEERASGLSVDKLVVVSHYAIAEMLEPPELTRCVWTAPKPCVWAGPHRLTKDNWFAAGNARNTALCFAPDGWIAYVDDLSVLLPGWLTEAVAAMQFPNTVTLGAYRKVKQMRVEHGRLIAYDQFVGGIDSREKAAALARPGAIACSGQWLYGCSLVAPVETFLAVNGWCEDICGGLGFEDCLTGVALENAGVKFRYNTAMMTFESEEDHHVEPAFRKSDYGVSPNDKSHKALELARGLKRFDNGFDLRAMRAAGKLHTPRTDWGTDTHGSPFPIPTEPSKEWFTGTPLAEL